MNRTCIFQMKNWWERKLLPKFDGKLPLTASVREGTHYNGVHESDFSQTLSAAFGEQSVCVSSVGIYGFMSINDGISAVE